MVTAAVIVALTRSWLFIIYLHTIDKLLWSTAQCLFSIKVVQKRIAYTSLFWHVQRGAWALTTNNSDVRWIWVDKVKRFTTAAKHWEFGDSTAPLVSSGTTEIAGVDNVARSKKQGWTTWHEVARVDNAGVDNVTRRSKGGQRGSGQLGTKTQGWTSREWTTWHDCLLYTSPSPRD